MESNLNNNFYNGVISKIVEMKSKGIGSRAIAKELGIGKSTVNQYYNHWCNEQQECNEKDQVKTQDSFEDNLDILCEHPDFSVSNLAKRLRSAHRTNTQLRKIQREITDTEYNFKEMLEGVNKAVSKVKVTQFDKSLFERPDIPNTTNKHGTFEILFSDWQIGKIGQHYNTPVAIKALKQYGCELLGIVSRKILFTDKIVFASLGDIVEDHMKHGIQSATACDSGLSEQISNAIVNIWENVLEPILKLGIPTEFVGVAGNHGSSQHKGMDIYKAGLYSYDYIIYTALKQLAKTGGYTNVTFNIPEGVFAHTEIYGNTVIYEHGYFNSATEKSMHDQMKKRGQQIKKHVEYFRCGDMHHQCSYDSHKLVLNGAFFGIDNLGVEYSGVLGFSSVPAQAVMWHQPESNVGKSSVKEFHTIQLAIVE